MWQPSLNTKPTFTDYKKVFEHTLPEGTFEPQTFPAQIHRGYEPICANHVLDSENGCPKNLGKPTPLLQ